MDAKKRNVLLIDDDKDFVQAAKVFLEGRGYEVQTAFNGQEGAAMIKSGKADIVILDIMMDYEVEGFNLAYKIRQDQDPSLKNLPIIIVSGFSQHLKEKKEKFEFILGREWPADAFMEKPIDLKALAKKIEEILLISQK